MIDATIVRAHYCAPAARKGGHHDSLHHQGLGRSRGGLKTKVNVRTKAAALPIGFVATPGEPNARAYPAFMDEAAPEPKVLIADRSYDADAIHLDVEARSGTPVIPTKRNRKVQIPHNSFVYALRNSIERGIGRLKNAPRPDALRQDRHKLSRLRAAYRHPLPAQALRQHGLTVRMLKDSQLSFAWRSVTWESWRAAPGDDQNYVYAIAL